MNVECLIHSNAEDCSRLGGNFDYYKITLSNHRLIKLCRKTIAQLLLQSIDDDNTESQSPACQSNDDGEEKSGESDYK